MGRSRTGSWRGGFFLAALEASFKEDLRKQLATMQRLQLLVDLFGVDWSHVWLQPLDGSVTLTPNLELSDFTHVLNNLPSHAAFARRVREMERCTWEAAAIIGTHLHVQQAIEELLATLKDPGASAGESKGSGTGRKPTNAATTWRRARSPYAARPRR